MSDRIPTEHDMDIVNALDLMRQHYMDQTDTEDQAAADFERDEAITIKRAMNEIQRLRQWVDDLQSGMYVNCVYCGHRYGPGETTPVSMADALKEHVEQCHDHPMSRLRAQLDRAYAGLSDVLMLMEQSAGVDGLHLNGDIAQWHELRKGGEFCQWLENFDAAVRELDQPGGGDD